MNIRDFLGCDTDSLNKDLSYLKLLSLLLPQRNFSLRRKLPTWAPVYLATVNISYSTGLHNVKKLAISQLAVW